MNLANVLTELGNRLGVGNIELDDNGGCLLAFDDDLLVDIEKAGDDPGFYLTATVGSVPSTGREAIFNELLEANLQGRGTGRASLALDGDLDEIVLNRYIDRDDIDLETLEQELEAFLKLLETWKQRHNDDAIGSLRAPTATATQPMTPPGGRIIRG